MVKGKTKQMLLETENEPMPVMTQQQRNALAERIAAVLRGRKRLGEERRSREREYQRRNNERALSRYYKVRGEFPEQSKRRLKELDLVYHTILAYQPDRLGVVGKSLSQMCSQVPGDIAPERPLASDCTLLKTQHKS